MLRGAKWVPGPGQALLLPSPGREVLADFPGVYEGPRKARAEAGLSHSHTAAPY